MHAQFVLVMRGLKNFKIPFVGLKDGNHEFEYQIDNTFFEAFHFDEYIETNIKIHLNFVKKSTLLELYFTAKGTVKIPCDVTNELFDLEVEATLPLVVNFGETFNDEHEEILVLPQTAFEVDIAQYVYEMIVLAVPLKRIHPDVLNGTMESEALDTLEELSVKEVKEIAHIDPRWDKLKGLIK